MEMKWFEGSIADAVATVKTKGAIFVVFSQGTDELSNAMTAALAKSQIAGQLQSESFVPIKLEGGSNAFQQFAQIYKFVPVPSVFFINTSGVPIEVVADGATEDAICTKLQTAITKSLATLSSGSNTTMSASSAPSSPPATPNVPVQEKPSTSSPPNAGNTAVLPQQSPTASPSISEPSAQSASITPSEVGTPADPSTSEPQMSLDEKVKHAKELLEKKKIEAEAEERRKEKERELERRRTAHEIAMARKQQQERELKEMMEERKRVKKEDADAKKKILEKIAEDRAERAARLATNEQLPQSSTPSTSNAPAPAPSPPPANVNTARLQFKLPSGETKNHSFPADTTLGQVRQFIDNNIVIPFSDYQLATTFPRREFTRSDNDRDLRSLELLPSAVILIVPMHRSSMIPVGPGWSTAFIKMFWDAMSPLFSVVRYVRNMVFGGRRAPPPRDTTSSTSTQQPEQSTSSTRPTPYQRERPTGIRKRGNVHTLSNRDDDSNDENNTWNGNSTQQM